jgi:hypothetical protein
VVEGWFEPPLLASFVHLLVGPQLLGGVPGFDCYPFDVVEIVNTECANVFVTSVGRSLVRSGLIAGNESIYEPDCHEDIFCLGVAWLL